MRPFEMVLIGIFAFAAIGGLLMFSKFKPAASEQDLIYGAKVEIWGTFDEDVIRQIFYDFSKKQKAFEAVSYKQIDKRNFQYEILNAIAEGRAPDLVLMPHSLLVTYRTKLYPIPYGAPLTPVSSGILDQRTFRDRYVDGAEIFMMDDGIYGIPYVVDPLIMYWNRNIFSNSGISNPPTTWETLINKTVYVLNKEDDWRNLTQSSVALGEYTNILYAKNILSMLMIQAGSSIGEEKEGKYRVTFDDPTTQQGIPVGPAVLSFYTQFALPNKEAYSWNRSKATDRDEFLSERLGMYFGMGSERNEIEQDNANLNYDVAVVPQGEGVTTKRTFGEIYAFAIPRASKNKTGAYNAAVYLASPDQAKVFAEAFSLAPASRALFVGNYGDSFTDILYQSALIARGWLDPDPAESSDVFKSMVEDSLSDNTRVPSIVNDSVRRIEALYE